jgi:hypothetical protein
MSLQEQQNFLARLYTDEGLRREFFSSPATIGAENDLNESEIGELAAIAREEMDYFAGSLVAKRRREAEKFLPLTRIALGKEFPKIVRLFAGTFSPQPVRKHLEDALEFCRFLQTAAEIEPRWAATAARFERAKLLFRSGEKNFAFARLDFDIREIILLASQKKPFETENIRPKKTFAFWLRIGKMEKHFIRSRPF